MANIGKNNDDETEIWLMNILQKKQLVGQCVAKVDSENKVINLERAQNNIYSQVLSDVKIIKYYVIRYTI